MSGAVFFFLLHGCQTIDDKSQAIIKKENEKLSKFIGQPESELKIIMGNPDSETRDDKGIRFLIYKSKKLIRKFGKISPSLMNLKMYQ